MANVYEDANDSNVVIILKSVLCVSDHHFVPKIFTVIVNEKGKGSSTVCLVTPALYNL